MKHFCRCLVRTGGVKNMEKGSVCMNVILKQLLRRKIVPAVLSILLGVAVIIARRGALELIVRVVGGFVIAGAVGLVVLYYARPEQEPGGLAMSWSMAAAACIAGLALIAFSGTLVEFFPVIMGISLVLNGLSNITEAAVWQENRILSGIVGILVVIFGILIIARPGAVADAIMIYVGGFLVINGIFDLMLLHTVREHLL